MTGAERELLEDLASTTALLARSLAHVDAAIRAMLRDEPPPQALRLVVAEPSGQALPD